MNAENEQRVQRAVELFRSGYNCSQAVVTAFADAYGLPNDVALRLSASFGGGIGRMRQTCGAACGMFMLAGLETGTPDPKDREGKAANYALVQRLAQEFARRNGAINCGELLGLTRHITADGVVVEKAERKPKRPCVQIVEEAARIWAEYLEKRREEGASAP